MFTVPERTYRDADGGLVTDGPAARFLAYPAGAEVSDDEAKRVGLLALFTPRGKQAERPADKMAARPADKQAADGGDEPDKPSGSTARKG